MSRYKTARVSYEGQSYSILCQETRGPCSLIALANYIILKRPMKIKPTIDGNDEYISEDYLFKMIEIVLRDQVRAVVNDKKEIDELLVVLPDLLRKLKAGIYVDPCFSSTSAFTETAELRLFTYLGIPVLHGWIPSPEDISTVNEAVLSYNDLTKFLADCDSSEINFQEHQVIKCNAIKDFLEENKSQLTSHGLQKLGYSMFELMSSEKGNLAILYRNEHFYVMCMNRGILHTLETDSDLRSTTPNVVWQTLSNVSGDGIFVLGDFISANKDDDQKLKELYTNGDMEVFRYTLMYNKAIKKEVEQMKENVEIAKRELKESEDELMRQLPGKNLAFMMDKQGGDHPKKENISLRKSQFAKVTKGDKKKDWQNRVGGEDETAYQNIGLHEEAPKHIQNVSLHSDQKVSKKIPSGSQAFKVTSQKKKKVKKGSNKEGEVAAAVDNPCPEVPDSLPQDTPNSESWHIKEFLKFLTKAGHGKVERPYFEGKLAAMKYWNYFELLTLKLKTKGVQGLSGTTMTEFVTILSCHLAFMSPMAISDFICHVFTVWDGLREPLQVVVDDDVYVWTAKVLDMDTPFLNVYLYKNFRRGVSDDNYTDDYWSLLRFVRNFIQHVLKHIKTVLDPSGNSMTVAHYIGEHVGELVLFIMYNCNCDTGGLFHDPWTTFEESK